MYVTVAGIGLFCLVWAWIRAGSTWTMVLAVFGVLLVGSGGVLDKVAHAVTGVIATLLNGVGGAM